MNKYLIAFIIFCSYNLQAQLMDVVHCFGNVFRIQNDNCDTVRLLGNFTKAPSPMDFRDIAYTPSGDLYAIKDRELLIADFTNNTWIKLHDLVPQYLNRYEGIVSDRKGNLYIEGAGLVKYIPSTDQLIYMGVMNNASQAFTFGSDLFFHKDDLYYFSNIDPPGVSQLYKIDTLNIQNSIKINEYNFDITDPKAKIYGEGVSGIVSKPFSCDSTTYLVGYSDASIFEFNLVNTNYSFVCNMDIALDFFGCIIGASVPFTYKEVCPLVLNLDADSSSSSLASKGYLKKDICVPISVPVVDTTDSFVRFYYDVDSIVINLINPADGNLELLHFDVAFPGITIQGNNSQKLILHNSAQLTYKQMTPALKYIRYSNTAANFSPGFRSISLQAWSLPDTSNIAISNLELIQPPFAGPDLDLSFCEKQAPQDLNQFILATKNGTWNISNGIFDPAKDKSGIYTYVVNAQSCPNDTALVNITVIPAPSVLLPKDTSFCSGINFIPYDILASGANLNKLIWQDGTIGLSYTISKPGQYIATADNGQGCIAADTFNVNELPSLSANIQGNHVLCPGTSSVLTASGGTNYLWSNGNTNATLNVTAPGVYTVTVSNVVACPDTASYVILTPPAIDVDYKISAPACKGDANGHVDLLNVISGDEPIVWKILNDQGKVVDPLQVSSGNYLIIATDVKNCADSMSIVIPDGEVLDIDLGTDITAKQGQTIQLKAITLSGNPIEFKWSPVNLLDNINYDEASIIANSNVTISVTAKNSNGCTAEDDLNISVNIANDIYVPNAFSPNGDGFNDKLVVYADDKIWHIEKFEVYGRWGQLVFHVEDAAPSNPNFGWNGYSNGQQANEGVYVYSLKMKNVNGKTVVLAGEVLVVK